VQHNEKYIDNESLSEHSKAKLSTLEQKSKAKLPWLKYAAIAILFLAPLLLFINQPNQNLYAEYVVFPKVNKVRSGAGNLFSKANMAYTQKDFSRAEKLYAETGSTLLKGNLYYGVCLMETEQYEKAREIFNFLASQNSADSPQAEWLWAMSYLRQGNETRAKKILLEIKEGLYKTRAVELLQKLD